MQVVAGINHILHLETSDDSGKKDVEVTVYEKLPANVKANESPLELTANKLVGPVAEVRAFQSLGRHSFSCRSMGCTSMQGHSVETPAAGSRTASGLAPPGVLRR